MPEFTGNVHNLELALPFPAPATGGNTVFVVGRTFGAPGSDVLDVWVDDTVSNSYDPPDGRGDHAADPHVDRVHTRVVALCGRRAAGSGPAHAGRVAAHRDRRNARAPGLADAAR